MFWSIIIFYAQQIFYQQRSSELHCKNHFHKIHKSANYCVTIEQWFLFWTGQAIEEPIKQWTHVGGKHNALVSNFVSILNSLWPAMKLQDGAMAPSELVVSYMSLVDVQLHQIKQDMACAEVSTVF